MRTILLLALLVPASAFAQPGSPPPPPPPPPAGYAPAPAYGAPVYGAPAAAADLRNGMTFEANLGLGWIRAAADGNSDTSDLGLGGLSLGVGGWVNPHLAITIRAAGVTYSENGSRLTQAFFGPSAQYWIDDHIWLGGGLGLSLAAVANDNGPDPDPLKAFGLDLRAGYTFSTSTESTFNVSFEVNPGFYDESGQSFTLTGIGILAGYQHL